VGPILLTFLPFLLAFQGSLLKPSAVQHVTIATSTSPETSTAGGKVTLALDVTPDRNIHVYAPGAKEFVAINLKITSASGATVGKPVYPPSENVLDPILNERIPEYLKAFRITQPITLRATMKSTESVTISGVLTYQACDEKMCFAPSEISANWTVKIR
jgi:cytochrome c biogenesis DsbD-like protein